MAVILYKRGDTHEVRGIKCEAKRFSVNSLKSALSQGWVTRPEDTVATFAPKPVKPVKIPFLEKVRNLLK